MVNRHFILFALAFAAALSGVAKTFDVDISTGRPAASNEAYYHGETIEFRAVRGRSVVTNVEYSCVYYQTNGMNQAWWKTDGLVFHPTNDVGAASYRFFLEGRDDLGRDWHANGLLRLLPSPGFTPNTIELPVATLDFAAVDVLNPPWTDPDYSTNNTALVETIEATAPAPGNYAAVSNAAMTALQSFTETDPTVPAWAKSTSKPSYSWSEITSKPSLATVATSGSYNDLSNKPTIPTVPTAQINAATTTNALQDAAIAGKADKADATLTERGFSAWVMTAIPDGLDPADVYLAWGDPGDSYGYEAWYFSYSIGWAWTDNTDQSITSLEYDGFAATRSPLPGYQLGDDDQHILAAQAQMVELGSSVATNAADIATLKDTTSTLSDSIPSVALTNETLYVNGQSIELGYEGGTNVTLAVDGAKLTVATNNVPVWTSDATSEKRIAMFIVPVNEGSPFTYKGFELKCSTNNFASAASESDKLQFYSQSEIADSGSGSTIDKMRLFVCTSHLPGRDKRSYSPIWNTIDYTHDLYSVVALVDVSCLKRHPEDDGAWLSEDNEDLTWCYLRDKSNDVEREASTDESLWRPIAPVRWFKEVPSWAR